MALNTAQDYVTAVRTLLQDTFVPTRYSDAEILDALNAGLLEARRLRADLFIGRAVPQLTALTDAVVFDPQYRQSLKFYTAGHVILKDTEDADTQRAATFIARFTAQLTGLQA